jgi:hypothetical protein
VNKVSIADGAVARRVVVQDGLTRLVLRQSFVLLDELVEVGADVPLFGFPLRFLGLSRVLGKDG